MPRPESIEAMIAALADHDYIADRNLAATLFLALELRRPLLIEGATGVGKSEVARVIAAILDRHLFHLRCHEALDVSSAVYEWNASRQMIELRIAELAHEADPDILTKSVFSSRFLIRGPILEAFSPEFEGSPVLLVEGIDRADQSFDAYLLDVLSQCQVTVPEMGTIRPAEPPVVVITSNHTRDISTQLRRHCLFHWIDYPDRDRELEILNVRSPGVPDSLSRDAVAFVQAVRERDLFEPPGVAETMDWIAAMMRLDCVALDPDILDDTLGILLKQRDDVSRIRGAEARRILEKIGVKGALRPAAG